MKKIFSVALCALMAVGSASAAKIYINPGHGGHDSDDRPTPLPCGVTMFYESDGNLSRGKALMEMVSATGHSYRMSRTTNNSSDDLALSTIASRSNSYGGYFMSLHTNGANAKANYTVAFYKDNASGVEQVKPSKAMATACAKWHNNNHLTNWTYSTPRGLGDYSFNGWNYGVLRTNSRPGYLVETVFHDYRPEALRLKSDLYNKYTAWQIMRAFLESPAPGGTLKGCIVGDVRDRSKSCGYTNYTTRGRDSNKAIEGATAILYNSSGTQVASMKTDNQENGFWGFFDLAAGSYSVEIKMDGYKTQKKSFTVSNNASNRWQVDLVAGVDNGISTSVASLDFGEVTVGSSKSATFTVTSTGLSADISVSSSNGNVTVSPATITKNTSGKTVTVKYTPSVAGSVNGTITLTSGSIKSTVSFTGSAKNPPLSFTEGWNYSENNGKKAAWMSDYVSYRNMAFGNGKLYVVDAANGVIKVLKAQTAEHLYDLDMTGVAGGAIKLVDVAFVDGKLVATNIASTTSGALKVYVWDNDNVPPRIILETTNLGTNDVGSMDRIGDCLEVKGDLTNGQLVYLAQQKREWTSASGTVSTDACNSLVTYTISNGVVSTTPTVADIDGCVIGLSPRAIPYGDDYWVAGQNYYPSIITANGQMTSTMTGLQAVQGNDIVPFTFKGDTYAFATDYDPGRSGVSATMLYNGRAALIDASDGWANAAAVGSYPSAGLGGTTRNTSMSSSICVAVNGTSGVEMWVLVHNQGIAYYKHGTVPTYSYADLNRPSVSLSASTLDFGATNIGSNKDLTLSITPSKLEGDVTLSISGANADCFRLNKKSFAKTDSKVDVIVGYYPTAQASHTATLTISSPNMNDTKVTLKGSGKPATEFVDNITALDEMWVYSTNKGNLPSWFDSANYTRDVAVNGGNLYVLSCKQWGTPVITILDAYTGASKGNLSVDGISGGRAALGAIDMLGGKLIGCNAVSATHTLTLYKWDSESAAPTKWAELTPADILGDQMSVSGDMTNGAIWFVATATNVVYKYTVSNGSVNATPTKITLGKAIGAQNGCASVAVAADGTIWVDGKDAVPMHFKADGTYIESLPTAVLGGGKVVGGNAIEIIPFGSKTYMTAMTYTDATNTLAGGAIVLVDITNGVDAATQAGIYPSNGLGTTRNTQFLNGLTHSLTDNGHTLNVWGIVALQGIAYYKYAGDKSTGVENLEIEGVVNNAPVEWYNLQGVVVDGENLVPGIYIRRQGNEVTKVLVK